LKWGLVKTIIFITIFAFIIQLTFPSSPFAENEDRKQVVENEEQESVGKLDQMTITYDDWYQSSVRYAADYLDQTKISRQVKGLYVTGSTAGIESKFQHLVQLLNETELNSLVIDVKEDFGYVTYQSNVPLVNEVRSDRKTFIKDIDDLLRLARENNIYTIARIVTFKDPFFAGAKPEYAIQRKTGGVWRDKYGVSWVDPYRKEVWDYNIAIAKEAAEKGFKEIQFDYVRFPANSKKVDREATFNNPENLAKSEVIAAFLAYAKEQLKDYPVYISADVFGLTTTTVDDMGIGQQWELITATVDYISPMMYPSHYANRSYGIPIPDANPYATIKNGLEDAIEKNNKVREQGQNVAIIRPWYQDFTGSWVKGHINYGPKEVLDQIRAGNELGIDQYLIWNAGNVYSEGAWMNQSR